LDSIAVRDGSGNVVTEYTYDAFGTVTATNPTFANAFQYTGRENDGLAGLYYYRARHYYPGVGRFIREDPIGFGGGNANRSPWAPGSSPIRRAGRCEVKFHHAVALSPLSAC